MIDKKIGGNIMAEHRFDYETVEEMLKKIRNMKLGDIDNRHIFDHVQDMRLQKGIAGTVIEQCVFNYDPDTRQEADLIISHESRDVETELKTTGMLRLDDKSGNKTDKNSVTKYKAKEPMSITAVGVFDIPEQTFEESHFLNKIENLLIVYYEYIKIPNKQMTPYDYKDFPVIDYEFHKFSDDEKKGLKKDWELVRDLCTEIVNRHPEPRTDDWKEAVKKDYIKAHSALRGKLTYINLAPKYPPRFRLKKPVVSELIANHFNQGLEAVEGKYIVLDDVDKKCQQLVNDFKNETIGKLVKHFDIPLKDEMGQENKSIAESIIVNMFGGTASSLNKISLFVRFGLIAKSITVTPSGGSTEDMKLFKIDFDEISREEIEVIDDDGNVKTRPIEFEDSDLYNYFNDYEFLCIVFEEPKKKYKRDENGKKVEVKHSLLENKFIGFKRLVFSEDFIDKDVRKLWNDMREKVIDRKLVDVVQKRKGQPIRIKSDGSISSAPNFMKSRQNSVFVRGSGEDSSVENKTEVVNGIKMIPQYYWIKGKAVVKEIEKQHGEVLNETPKCL